MIHSVSKDLATQVEKYGTDKKKIHVIYSGLDLQSFQFYKKSDWESHNPFQFISVGRFHWKKGYFLFCPRLSAFPKVLLGLREFPALLVYIILNLK